MADARGVQKTPSPGLCAQAIVIPVELCKCPDPATRNGHLLERCRLACYTGASKRPSF